MPFERPTLPQIVQRTEADMVARLGGGPLLDKSQLKVFARVLAGGSHLEHGHLDDNARQLIWDTAEGRLLERWASIFGILRKAATFAVGSVVLTGVNGTTIPSGTRVKRADGIEYATDLEVTIVAATATAAVTSVVSGVNGNAAAATELQLSSPVPGIDAAAVVDSSGLGAGADEETDEALRLRFLLGRRQPPTGGSAADYVAWALEVGSVTRAWTLPGHFGTSTVGVTFVADDLPSIIPDSILVAEVQAKLELERPVTAQVTAFAPIPNPLNPTIQVAPNTADVRAAITTAVEELVNREAEPGGTLLVSHIREAISNAAGESDHVLIAPAGNVTVNLGELTTPGTITFAAIA